MPHAGADSRAFSAVVELGDILERIAEVAEPPTDGVMVESQIGILWDAEGWWSWETPHLPNDAIAYSEEVRAAHRAFWRSGHSVDFVRPGGDVSRYRLLVVPSLYALTAQTAEWLEDYVRSGGHLVVGFASGTADENQRIATGGYLGMLRSLLGIRSEQVLPCADGDAVTLDTGMSAGAWTELLHVESAEVLARYASGPLAGEPAITRNTVGAGTAIYVSTKLEQPSWDAFLDDLATGLDIGGLIENSANHGVEAVRRRGANGDYLFLLHHGSRPVVAEGEGVDLVSGESDTILIPPGGVAVIREGGRSWEVRLAGESEV